MTFEIKQWDENGRELAIISVDTLKALAPLTNDPDSTLAKLGIDDVGLKTALHHIAELSKQS